MASATSSCIPWGFLVLLLYMCHAIESLSADGNSLLLFKYNVVDRRGVLRNWLETDDNPCSWSGVTCTNDTAKRVVALNLPSMYLGGTISSSLCDLESLYTLVLSDNSLSGQIPVNISSLSNLIYLRLGRNALTGTIPSLPASLLFLTLQNNFLTGNITSLQGLSLIELDLHGNSLSGTIADSPVWTRSVEQMDLSGNELAGSLPSAFANMGNVFYMNISSNKFTGEIPGGSWTTGDVMDFSKNQLSGSIPGELLRRRYLNLSSNSLGGSINITTTYHSPEALDLSNNQLVGAIPDIIDTEKAGTFQYLCLQNNYLSGNLQNILSANFSSLRELRLGGNRLTVGTLPILQVHSFPLLQVLELSQSNVEGELRSDVFNSGILPFLRVLDLSDNQLEGTIPAGLMQMLSLQELRLARNFLTGDIQAAPGSSWKNLAVLDLSHNLLSLNSNKDDNTLQNMFSFYPSLRELRLGNNFLTRSVLPTRVGELPFLEILDLSHSNLDGVISAHVYTNDSLPSLKYLDLSNNQLQGQVPDGLVQMPQLTYLYLANNNLTGPLPLLPASLFNATLFTGNPGLCGAPLPSCHEGRQADGVQLWLVFTIIAACLLLSGATIILLGWRWRIEVEKHKQDAELIAALLDRDTALMPLRDLKRATDNFSERFQIGVGGFGTVYGGTLDNGSKVAIKRSHHEGTSEDKCQFLNEVKILSQVHHRNLVRLLGCCLANKVALLVFEYVHNGTLEEHLRRKRGKVPLSWEQRLRIAVQTADALDYLHSSANPPIYHLDVKSANILLDENLNAKVADFGISKLAPGVESTHVTARGFQGTIGYMDPESVISAKLTGKSDVYAFGVVLLELISAKAAVDRTRGDGPEVSLINWVAPLIEAGRLESVIDPALSNTFHSVDGKESIVSVARLAVKCSSFNSGCRPSMQEVWKDLHAIWLLCSDNCTQPAAVLVDSDEEETFSLFTGPSTVCDNFSNTNSEIALSSH